MSADFLNQNQKKYSYISDRQTPSLGSVLLPSHPNLRDRGSGRLVDCSSELTCN